MLIKYGLIFVLNYFEILDMINEENYTNKKLYAM